MTLPELQSCLDRLGVSLSLRLVVDAPVGVMTPEVKSALLAHKPALLALLVATPPAPPPEVFVASPALLARFAALAALPADDYDREERAAIMQFEAGLTRLEAEHRAGLVRRREAP